MLIPSVYVPQTMRVMDALRLPKARWPSPAARLSCVLRCIEFRAGEIGGGAVRVEDLTASDQHLAILQQCRPGGRTREVHVAGSLPGAGGRVVEFGAVVWIDESTNADTTFHQHLAVSQQRGGVVARDIVMLPVVVQ